MMSRKKKIWLVILTVFFSFAGYYGPGIPGYIEYQKVATAVGGFPWQDGGVISAVLPFANVPCVLDTPAPPAVPTTCAISCPMITALTPLASACVGYYEMEVIGQNGTMVIAVPLGFIFSGGGIIPSPGTQFIAGGMMYYQPAVIGIPGVAASRVIKLADFIKRAFSWI
jgi:hypothetical protein